MLTSRAQIKALILTQEETLYLPNAFGKVCEQLGDRIKCVVILPAMSTHGGSIKGFIKHTRLFGLRGVLSIGMRIVKSRILDIVCRSKRGGTFRSLRSVCTAYGLPYYKVQSIKSPEIEEIIKNHAPDLLISISCPQVIGKKMRDHFPLGCINVHGSPLPKYRGLMPSFWVMRNGEIETAVTVHDLVAKLDDGEIILQRTVPIAPEDTWDSLVRKTKSVGADILIEAVKQIENDTVKRKPNLEKESTYFGFPSSKDRKAFLAMGRRFF